MKVGEVVKLTGEMLKRLHGFGIKMDDYKYLEMYEEVKRIVGRGNKMTYAVAVMCEKYNVCERTVYKVVKHFDENCTKQAVG